MGKLISTNAVEEIDGSRLFEDDSPWMLVVARSVRILAVLGLVRDERRFWLATAGFAGAA